MVGAHRQVSPVWYEQIMNPDRIFVPSSTSEMEQIYPFVKIAVIYVTEGCILVLLGDDGSLRLS